MLVALGAAVGLALIGSGLIAHRLTQSLQKLSAATSALSIEGGGPRLTLIEALERAAEAELKLGRRQEALDFYNRSLALAGTPAYIAPDVLAGGSSPGMRLAIMSACDAATAERTACTESSVPRCCTVSGKSGFECRW